jgi:hypothetical protein
VGISCLGCGCSYLMTFFFFFFFFAQHFRFQQFFGGPSKKNPSPPLSPSNIKTILDEKKVVGFGHQFINFFGHTVTTENGDKSVQLFYHVFTTKSGDKSV